MSCAKCKFFNENRCLRFPPTPTQYGEAVYPRVTETYPSCGEFAEIIPATIGVVHSTTVKTSTKKKTPNGAKNTINKKEEKA